MCIQKNVILVNMNCFQRELVVLKEPSDATRITKASC